MSNAVFPALPGISFGTTKTPIWSTKIQRAVSGKELRTALYSYPIYKIGLSYEVLRAGAEAELQQLVGFFNSRKGSFDSFLYSDPSDNAVTGQGFGVGDGVTKTFQLVRAFGGHTEPVMNLDGEPVILVNGVAGSAHSVSSLGVVTFTTAPAAGADLTWDGSYYYRCRFERDQVDLEEFMYQLWKSRRIDLYGSLGVKV